MVYGQEKTELVKKQQKMRQRRRGEEKKRKEKETGNAWSAVVPDLSFVPILHPHVIKTTGKTTSCLVEIYHF